MLILILFFGFSVNLSAQLDFEEGTKIPSINSSKIRIFKNFGDKSNVIISTNCRLVANNKDSPFILNNGKWNPSEDSNPSGIISLTISIEDKESSFNYKVDGLAYSGELLFIQCDQDKYFYLKEDFTVIPFNNDYIQNYNNVNETIESYQTKESKDIAWAIWLLCLQENSYQRN